MKAIAVHPGTPNSMHLRDVDRPRVSDVDGGRGVLVEVIRVGVDGTDKEINAAEYGEGAPRAGLPDHGPRELRPRPRGGPERAQHHRARDYPGSSDPRKRGPPERVT